jgi:DNA-binding CsgD family transcriptional regulator
MTSGKGQAKGTAKSEHVFAEFEPGLLLVDSSFNAIACNREAFKILRTSHSGHHEGSTIRIPEKLLEELRKSEQGAQAGEVTWVSPAKSKYLCHVIVMEPFEQRAAGHHILLVMRRHFSLEDALHEVAAEFKLTEREREALEGISKGMNGRELAKSMKISPNTVKAYMHLIMVKMNVATRAAMIAKVLEHRHRDDGHQLTQNRAAAHGV